MGKSHINRTIKIPRGYTPAQREAIAQDVLDYLRDRTSKGKGYDKDTKTIKKFGKYSKEYTESLEFKIAGKSKSNVNLELSSEMLYSMDATSKTSDSITWGFENASGSVKGKAEGNIRGTYGTQREISGKRRDFLTLTQTELENKILKKYPLDKPNKLAANILKARAAREAAKELAEEASAEIQ